MTGTGERESPCTPHALEGPNGDASPDGFRYDQDDYEWVLVLAGATTPDLILLDWSMPAGMGGREFLTVLRDTPKWSSVPVIVVSGEPADGPVREATALGARDVLVKSAFGLDELFASIRRHLPA